MNFMRKRAWTSNTKLEQRQEQEQKQEKEQEQKEKLEHTCAPDEMRSLRIQLRFTSPYPGPTEVLSSPEIMKLIGIAPMLNGIVGSCRRRT
ncbi:GH24305 [Drosophila grimshawi]|uniref:GH24305 n=1 Tax=Drosophila grimshawi TaxID=7222 RepID=B4JML2_DROGR|nr:GH24305 [Drosophila grimshawi]